MRTEPMCRCGAALVVDGCIATEVEHECTKGRHEPGCPCQGIRRGHYPTRQRHT